MNITHQFEENALHQFLSYVDEIDTDGVMFIVPLTYFFSLWTL